MTTISIVNQKGGVAKTSTAHALGAGLIHKGYRVLYVDLDPQGNLTYSLAGDSSKDAITTLINDQIEKGSCNPEEVIQHLAQGDLISSTPNLAGADTILADVIGKEYKLKEILAPLNNKYDFCILDCPPSLGTMVVNALVASDEAIAPSQADIYSLIALSQLAGTIQTVRKYCNPDLRFLGVVLTRYSVRAVLSKEITAQVAEFCKKCGTKLFKTTIREATAIKEAQLLQTDIYTYAPKSNASKDYTALVNEILEDI